jgi:Sigma-70, region 4
MLEPAEDENVQEEGQAAGGSELPAQPEVEKIRSRININQGRVRSKTIAGKRLTREERRLAQLIVYPGDVDRPETRSECQSMPRPCPYVSCAHHLYLDVNPASGAIKLNFPHLEVWEMKETCALDVADRGGITLEEVGEILNLTRERIRQVEVRGLGKLRDETADDEPGSR